MLRRLLNVPKKQSFFLFGPRQTGKSTLIKGVLSKNAWSIDLLRGDTFLRYSKDPTLFRLEAETKIASGIDTIFIDEVQKIPSLLDEVHSLIESHAVRFILTGSSARKLKRGAANLLAGRAVMRHLHPLVLDEYEEAFSLERTLRFGSLPAVVTHDDEEAKDLLRTYAEIYLREEIQAEALVRNLGGFARFLEIAATQCGDILNYSAVGRDAMLNTRTVQEYFQILEDTLIGFRVNAWAKSPRGQMVKHPRFYLFDTGVTNALCRRLSAELEPSLKGRLFEQWVVLECARKIDYTQSETRLFYWRTNHGAEVDLLFERQGKLVLAVEIKSKARVVGADVSGLRSFSEAHPKIPCIVVSSALQPYRLGDIEVLPYRDFFVRLSAWI